jgi:hypothetical protein
MSPPSAFPVTAYWSYGETCPMSYVADSSPDSCCAPTASYAPSDSIHHDRRQVDRRVQPPLERSPGGMVKPSGPRGYSTITATTSTSSTRKSPSAATRLQTGL